MSRVTRSRGERGEKLLNHGRHREHNENARQRRAKNTSPRTLFGSPLFIFSASSATPREQTLAEQVMP